MSQALSTRSPTGIARHVPIAGDEPSRKLAVMPRRAAALAELEALGVKPLTERSGAAGVTPADTIAGAALEKMRDAVRDVVAFGNSGTLEMAADIAHRDADGSEPVARVTAKFSGGKRA